MVLRWFGTVIDGTIVFAKERRWGRLCVHVWPLQLAMRRHNAIRMKRWGSHFTANEEGLLSAMWAYPGLCLRCFVGFVVACWFEFVVHLIGRDDSRVQAALVLLIFQG